MSYIVESESGKEVPAAAAAAVVEANDAPPHIKYIMLSCAPNYQNGGGLSQASMFHTKKAAIAEKNKMGNRYNPEFDGDDSMVFEYTDSDGDYVYMKICEVDMNKPGDSSGGFFYHRMNT